MSGRLWWVRSRGLLNPATRALWVLLGLACIATAAQTQERREREPNSVYAERRAKLAGQADGPIVLWGFTGREEVSQAYMFAQEENFYYLTGHNEEGAGLIKQQPAYHPPSVASGALARAGAPLGHSPRGLRAAKGPPDLSLFALQPTQGGGRILVAPRTPRGWFPFARIAPRCSAQRV